MYNNVMNFEINKGVIKNEGYTTSEKSFKMRIVISVIMFLCAAFSIIRVVFMIGKIGITLAGIYKENFLGFVAKIFTKSYPVVELKFSYYLRNIYDAQNYRIIDIFFAIAQSVLFCYYWGSYH